MAAPPKRRAVASLARASTSRHLGLQRRWRAWRPPTAGKLRAMVSLVLPIFSYGLGCMTLLQAELCAVEAAYINRVARLAPMDVAKAIATAFPRRAARISSAAPTGCKQRAGLRAR